ncbi:hypothetical protein Desac_2037 [Desulfobacca acetoxidans DSM 11109]|uniref:Uncharacterized protein n=1 Tax=Desulfobacca acetoxidans (strain ATCC 700848 / DSM 11109 / ASRB2) TaxID=880072 RepID=F2NI97_DESAR|nr:hypothetical protein Desac_2037 [Desulfobacca acetoxidans DSM 11109]
MCRKLLAGCCNLHLWAIAPGIVNLLRIWYIMTTRCALLKKRNLKTRIKNQFPVKSGLLLKVRISYSPAKMPIVGAKLVFAHLDLIL